LLAKCNYLFCLLNFLIIVIMKFIPLRNTMNVCSRIRVTMRSKCLMRNLSAVAELTRIRYPDVKRGNYSHIQNEDLEAFSEILDKNRVITEESDLEGYNTDWLQTVRGESKILLKPKSTNEVSDIVSYCYNKNLAICPQGGNTGLVGGSVPVFDEVIVSTQLMNQVEALDENSSVVRIQAGVVLEKLDSYLAEHGLMVPLDLGAKGSCQLGGNVSTNAGGLRLLRYGSLHSTVLGVEVVLPQEGGPIMDLGYNGGLKKDNTGYDLKHLFIGSEGTLGLVTRIALACPPRPNAINVSFLGLESYPKVLETFKAARKNLGEILSSCEFIDAGSLECVTQNLGLQSPLQDRYPFYMLIETSGSNKSHDEEKLSQFLETLMSDGTVLDGTVSESPSRQSSQIWELRERIAEALKKDGYTYKYDISLPLDTFYDSVTVMQDRLGSDVIRCVGYGHVGDGNMHLNITSKVYDKIILDKIEPFLYEYTSKVHGSISAEHGLGFKKRNYMHFSKPDSAIQLMHQIKPIFDPKKILNPYTCLPDVKN